MRLVIGLYIMFRVKMYHYISKLFFVIPLIFPKLPRQHETTEIAAADLKINHLLRVAIETVIKNYV